jgi:formylglycine-generating enzyme required for sulfatase activity
MPKYLILAILLTFPLIAAQECPFIGDADRDGVKEDVDNCLSVSNPDQLDTDQDGIGDACDPDIDNDGLVNEEDNCPLLANREQADKDADSLGDACDSCPSDPSNDADEDGICIGPGYKKPMFDDKDNCPDTYNPNQTDEDADKIGDDCDACPLDPDNDKDGDGVCGDIDNCSTLANTDQKDIDDDKFGNACDNCPEKSNNQYDGDGDKIGNACDNCPEKSNPEQANADGDTLGDVCDTCPLDGLNDADNDSVCGDVDNCPTLANSDQVDCDGDKLGDTCDSDNRRCVLEMVSIPAGKFWRGSCSEYTAPPCNPGAPGYTSSDYIDSETPLKEITLSAFAIGKYEVTVAEYALCVTAGKCATPATGNSHSNPYYFNWNVFGRVQHPINGVSWFDAATYANWRSEQEGFSPCYNTTSWLVNWSCTGYRLPTEAEWEKASRGIDGREYSWGNAAPTCDLLNTASCVGLTTPVGSYPSGISIYGVYDMGGNVGELVNDWWTETYYSIAPITDPKGPSAGLDRVLRGGSWSTTATCSRSADRRCESPDGRGVGIGFRLARSIH